MFEKLARLEQDVEALWVTRLSYRSPLLQEEEQKVKRWDSRVTWTALRLPDARQELDELSAWARSIKFAFYRLSRGRDGMPRRQRVVGSISRAGTFVANEGVRAFWEMVVYRSCQDAAERTQVFRGRGRGRSFTRPVRPIVIAYPDPVFADSAQNEELVSQLRALRDTSVSVFHGNPYLHACVVDYLDGSSFDVWVVDADRITIVPGARATTASLGRLSSHLTEEFREGELREFEA